MKLFVGAVVVNSHTTCHYNGKVYDIGASFNSTDGCNICHCDRFGFTSCTERACLNGTYNLYSITSLYGYGSFDNSKPEKVPMDSRI